MTERRALVQTMFLLFFTGFQNGLAILDINQVEFLDSSAESKEQKKVAAQIGRGELPGSFHIDLPSSPTHLVRFKPLKNILNFCFLTISDQLHLSCCNFHNLIIWTDRGDIYWMITIIVG